MFFGELDTAHAMGCYLAHSIKTGEGRISKGTQLSSAHLQQLLNSGFTRITVARLEHDD